TAYGRIWGLEFRRVLFRSLRVATTPADNAKPSHSEAIVVMGGPPWPLGPRPSVGRGSRVVQRADHRAEHEPFDRRLVTAGGGPQIGRASCKGRVWTAVFV